MVLTGRVPEHYTKIHSDVSTWRWRLGVGWKRWRLGARWNDVTTMDLKSKPVTKTGIFKKYEATFLTTKPLIQGKMIMEP